MHHSPLRAAAAIAAGIAMSLGLSGCLGLPLPKTPVAEDPVAEESIVGTVAPTEPADAVGDQGAALETYVAAAQAVIPGLEEQFVDTYSAIRILAVQPDTVEYAYDYLNPMDAASTAANMDASLDDYQSAVDSALIPEMVANGITVDPKVRYTYYNSDGTLIWTHTFAGS